MPSERGPPIDAGNLGVHLPLKRPLQIISYGIHAGKPVELPLVAGHSLLAEPELRIVVRGGGIVWPETLSGGT